MLYSEIIAVCSEIHTKHINTLCGQSVELLNVKLLVHIVTTVLYNVKLIFAQFLKVAGICLCPFRRHLLSYIKPAFDRTQVAVFYVTTRHKDEAKLKEARDLKLELLVTVSGYKR
jgi:hypothetical protein